MKREITRRNARQASVLRGWGAMACAAAALTFAPLAAPADSVIIVAPRTNFGHVCTPSCSSSCSYYRSPQYSYSSSYSHFAPRSHSSCSYYSSHGFHQSNCGCGYKGGHRTGYSDGYYQRRRQEDYDRRVKELKREEDRSRDRQDREDRLERERRERFDRIEKLRADPEASAPKFYGYSNPSVEEAVTAYFVYHQQKESRQLSGRSTAAPGPAPAAGLTAVGVGEWTYYYKDGRFYNLVGDTLTPIDAPIGALVFDIPAGRKAVAAGEQPIYECNGAFYQYTFVGDKPMYEVVDQPAPLASEASSRDAIAMQ